MLFIAQNKKISCIHPVMDTLIVGAKLVVNVCGTKNSLKTRFPSLVSVVFVSLVKFLSIFKRITVKTELTQLLLWNW